MAVNKRECLIGDRNKLCNVSCAMLFNAQHFIVDLEALFGTFVTFVHERVS